MIEKYFSVEIVITDEIYTLPLIDLFRAYDWYVFFQMEAQILHLGCQQIFKLEIYC
jgi:hypothetical protein